MKKRKTSSKVKSIAVLTSGGDAPGMNAAIRAVVRYGLSRGCKMHGILKGYSGLLESLFTPLHASSVANIIQRGGTILKTDRCEAFKKKSVRKDAAEILHRKEIDALIVIGGDGSFTGAQLLESETGFPCVGIPGTIDNDIFGTELTIGFDTAVNTAIQAIDKIRDTASSHDRIFLVEVMGHSSGFIALSTGIGGGAETILVPEIKESIPEVCRMIERGIQRGKTSSIIVVAEGKVPGRAVRVAQSLESQGYLPKVCILGHTQRGGTPTAQDRLLASLLGTEAVKQILAGQSGGMIGIKKGHPHLVPFHQVIGRQKPIDKKILSLAQILAG